MIIKELLRKLGSVITWPFRWIGKALRGLAWSMRNQSMRYRLTPELNQIANRHINKVVGSNGSLTREFNRRVKRHKLDRNPMGEPETRLLIESLLKRAIAEREQLSGQVARSAEIGALYSNYYGKLQKINDLEAEAAKCKLALDAAKEEYDFAKKTYEAVRDSTYAVSVDGIEVDNQTGGGTT